MYRIFRSAALLTSLAAAACGGAVPVGPVLLTQDEVGGVYAACSMEFRPTGLASVDLLLAATEQNPAPPLPVPNLKLSRQVPSFELEYTPRGDVLPVRLTGTYVLGASTVRLEFAASPSALESALLLTNSVPLSFSREPTELTIASPRYSVARQEYGRLAGLSQDEMRNLQDRIEGTLTGRFARGPCS
ncbi:hypothetical protein BH23GEM8_BH23GEM8_13650 [soil metagenome]